MTRRPPSFKLSTGSVVRQVNTDEIEQAIEKLKKQVTKLLSRDKFEWVLPTEVEL